MDINNKVAMWLCKCNCGQTTIVRGNSLGNGNTKSCGCLSREKTRKRLEKHGCSKTKIYDIWKAMIQRCVNPKAQAYKNYGGRGISVCKRWRKFENFLEDMGKQLPGQQIDRIDNNKSYCKSNCRWSTRKQQQRNKRNNRLITFRGQTKCLIEWSEKLGIDYQVIRIRLRQLNWSIEKALTTPVKEKK